MKNVIFITRIIGIVIVLPSLLFSVKHGYALPQYHDDHFKNVRDFGAVGDGIADDTAAIQSAIDYNVGSVGEKKHGVVFFPSGTYKISDQLVVWKGTILRGDFSIPPTLLLAGNAPGYNDITQPKAVIITTNGWNVDPLTHQIDNLQNTTFYTGIEYIDIKVMDNNRGAVAIHWRCDQQTYIYKVNITLQSGLYGIRCSGGGRWINKVTVNGGQVGYYGEIEAQSILKDCTFMNQTDVAVKASQWILVMKSVVVDSANYGLYWDGIRSAIIVDSTFRNTQQPYHITQNTGYMAIINSSFTTSAWVVNSKLAGTSFVKTWVVGETWMNGQQILSGSLNVSVDTSDLPDIDANATYNVIGNVVNYGARGDGLTDDTQAIRNAIAANAVVFLPMGTYKVTGTIDLNSGTKLIGEHQSATKILLADGTPGFGDSLNPVGVIRTADTATASVLVKELSIDVGQNNPGAVALHWRSGGTSTLRNVHITTSAPVGGAKYGIWITGNGSGTFMNSANGSNGYVYGIYASGVTSARFYASPSEHMDIWSYVLKDVSDYVFYVSQTEGDNDPNPNNDGGMYIERGESIRIIGQESTYIENPGVLLNETYEPTVVGMQVLRATTAIKEISNGKTVTIPGDSLDWKTVIFYYTTATELARWGFNEGTGTTTADLSGKGWTLAMYEGPSGSNPVTKSLWGTAGDAPSGTGYALSLDGVDEYASPSIGAQDSLWTLSTLTDFSFSAWIKHSSLIQGGVILGHTSVGGMGDQGWLWDNSEYASNDSDNPRFAYRLQDNITRESFCYTGINYDNIWTHWVMTYDGDNGNGNAVIRHYINGQLKLTALQARGTFHNDTWHPLYVGALGRNDNNERGSFFPGMIDEVRIFDGVLSANQVTALYNAPDMDF